MNTDQQSKTKRLLMHLGSLVITACVFSLMQCSDDAQKVTNFNTLVKNDEFNTAGAPDPLIWNYNIGTGQNGWGNSELQYYTDRSKNVTVQNGYLIISALKESYNGSAYTSARLLTKDKFDQKYGRFEARIKLPWGQGIWPAFWMLGADIDTNPWPAAGEIDIMELRGQTPTTILGTVHGPGYAGGQSISKSYTLKNGRFDTEFHVFGIEWGPEYVNFYVDNVLYNQITPADVKGEWVFNKPFFILINMAVGGNFVGAPNSETVFPQTMLVDYVRVYK